MCRYENLLGFVVFLHIMKWFINLTERCCLSVKLGLNIDWSLHAFSVAAPCIWTNTANKQFGGINIPLRESGGNGEKPCNTFLVVTTEISV